MKLQQLYSYTRKAIDHYQLIESPAIRSPLVFPEAKILLHFYMH